MNEKRLAQIQSEVRAFVQTAYPRMEVKAEYWSRDPSRIALFFTDESFKELYPQQRYHYLIHQIPDEYYRSCLENTLWFELAPGELPEDIEYPDHELITTIKADVLAALRKRGFFTALDDLLCSERNSDRNVCKGDFGQSKQVLTRCGFAESDWPDVFNVLMDEGGFCDCEVLYNVAPESRLRAEHWRKKHPPGRL
jgi:uncharacterized protein DUF2695